MSEATQLLTTLKRRLRAHGLAYRDVAPALGLSEASVKRLFSTGRMSLERVEQVCRLLGVTLAELAQEADAAAPRLRTLSPRQERELAGDEKLLLVATCVLNHWTAADITARYRLSETDCLRYLLKLDRLRLIDLLPGNRIRLAVARDFDWLPDGPIRRYFRQHGQDEFLASRFGGDDEVLAFAHGMLGAAAQAELQAELRRLRARFADLHEQSLALPLARRHGTGLLLAMREWEPTAFARLRRAPGPERA